MDIIKCVIFRKELSVYRHTEVNKLQTHIVGIRIQPETEGIIKMICKVFKVVGWMCLRPQ